jgi:hypothetical protein
MKKVGLDRKPIAEKAVEVLKKCCGADCIETKALNTKGATGTYVVVDGKKYGVGIVHMPQGMTCENASP